MRPASSLLNLSPKELDELERQVDAMRYIETQRVKCIGYAIITGIVMFLFGYIIG